jgi:DNA-binding CsgD family transcriptional regulator
LVFSAHDLARLRDIAARLEISPHTIHNHVKEIYRKMGVNSRPELLARFVSESKKKRLGQ